MYRDNGHRIRRIFFVIEELTDEYKFPVNEKIYAFVCHERVRCATKHGNKRGRLIPNTYKYWSFGFYRYIYLRINMHITKYGVRGVLEWKADRWIFPNTRNRTSITIKVWYKRRTMKNVRVSASIGRIKSPTPVVLTGLLTNFHGDYRTRYLWYAAFPSCSDRALYITLLYISRLKLAKFRSPYQLSLCSLLQRRPETDVF